MNATTSDVTMTIEEAQPMIEESPIVYCKQCGKSLRKQQRRTYCNDACKQAYYRASKTISLDKNVWKLQEQTLSDTYQIESVKDIESSATKPSEETLRQAFKANQIKVTKFDLVTLDIVGVAAMHNKHYILKDCSR